MTILYTYVASAAQYPGNLIHIGQHLTICVKCPLHTVRVELGVVMCSPFDFHVGDH